MRQRISLEEAHALLRTCVTPLGAVSVPAAAALGRTLARAVSAPLDQPPFDRSPLDGYALRAADTVSASRARPVSLEVVETLYAGEWLYRHTLRESARQAVLGLARAYGLSLGAGAVAENLRRAIGEKPYIFLTLPFVEEITMRAFFQ